LGATSNTIALLLNSIFGPRFGNAIVGALVALEVVVGAGMFGLCRRATASSFDASVAMAMLSMLH
jgi:hypothetical protein